MLGVKPRSFSRMVMDYSQMEEVLTIAIQQLKEKNSYDYMRDDLKGQYDDNVIFYWSMFVVGNALVLISILISIGYVWAMEYWKSLFVFVCSAFVELIVLYRGLRQLSECIAISRCLSIITYERPDLFHSEAIKKLSQDKNV